MILLELKLSENLLCIQYFLNINILKCFNVIILVQGGHDPAAGGAPPQEKIFTDEELMQLIDPILTMDDTDFDGFIDYPEFVIAQNKAGSTQKQSV